METPWWPDGNQQTLGVIMIMMTVSHPKRVSLAAATVYASLVVAALVVTLRSLSKHGFDGLNNVLQVPLALPWWFVVPAPGSHTVDAWMTAGLGLLNALLLYVLLRRFLQERPASYVAASRRTGSER